MINQVPGGSSSTSSSRPADSSTIQDLRKQVKSLILNEALGPAAAKEATQSDIDKVDIVVFPTGQKASDVNNVFGGRTVVRYSASVIDYLDEEQLKHIIQAVQDQRLVLQNIVRDTHGAVESAKIFKDPLTRSGENHISKLYNSQNKDKYTIEKLGEEFKIMFNKIMFNFGENKSENSEKNKQTE
jgi:hypothetical protein